MYKTYKITFFFSITYFERLSFKEEDEEKENKNRSKLYPFPLLLCY